MNKETGNAIGLLVLRVVAGVGIGSHGMPILFNGGAMSGFTRGVAAMGFPMPVVFAWAAALSQFVGGILLILGLKARVAALFIFITMSVAVFVRHANDAFAVRELAMLYWAISLAIFFVGPGRFSLDRA